MELISLLAQLMRSEFTETRVLSRELFRLLTVVPCLAMLVLPVSFASCEPASQQGDNLLMRHELISSMWSYTIYIERCFECDERQFYEDREKDRKKMDTKERRKGGKMSIAISRKWARTRVS